MINTCTRTTPIMLTCLLASALLGSTSAQAQTPSDTVKPATINSSKSNRRSSLPITHLPSVLSTDCNDGAAKLYDECADQVSILKNAINIARAEQKKVLIIYGGEWCIWCHVLDNYFHGKFRSFDYQWRYSDGDIQKWSMRERVSPADIEDAWALNEYVANNFVVAHIENVYANGNEAVALTGFDPENIYYYPFIVALHSNGKYASNMVSTDAIKGFEVRESGGEEFRGYDRRILLTQLKKLKADASIETKSQ